MSVRTLVRRLFARPDRTATPVRTRLGLTALEAREVPATFIVTNNLDAGTGSLRWAVKQATTTPGNDVVKFASPGMDISLSTPISLSNAAGVTGRVSVEGGQTTITGKGFNLAAGSSATLSGVTISYVRDRHAAIANDGVLTLTRCRLSDCDNVYAESSGGGIRNTGSLLVADCVFSGCDGGDVRSTFHGAGAIYNFDGTLVVEKSTFTNNKGASARFGGSGGIASLGGSVSVTGCKFSSNAVAGGGGAAINLEGCTATIRGSRISNNSGIGVLSNASGTVIENSYIASNAKGGLESWDGFGFNGPCSLTVRNCTVINNRTFGVFNGSGDATTTLFNTLVAGNVSTTGIPKDISGTLTTASRNNLVASAASAGGLRNGVNGNLVGINGTGTRPMATIVNTDGTLVAGSVAINGGDNAFAPTYAAFDLAGKKRVVGTRIDIGAFEVQ